MELAFLGTGAAFSRERYNGAVVVDRRILLDSGAPLLPHMHRLGIDPDQIEALFLTHFHGDHLAGLIPFLGYRAFSGLGPFTVVAPEGGEARVDRLMRAGWGDEWSEWLERFELRHVLAGPAGEAAGVRFETVRLDHGSSGCTGYRLWIDGRQIAYAGDTQATPPLDDLVRGAEVAISEATGPGEVYSHTSWDEAAALARRHPRTRFFFNHVFAGAPEGAASDLQVVEV